MTGEEGAPMPANASVTNDAKGKVDFGKITFTLDDLNKANKRLDSIRDQSKEYVDEAGKSRIERDASLKEIEVLNSKIVQLENMVKLKQLKDSIDEKNN